MEMAGNQWLARYFWLPAAAVGVWAFHAHFLSDPRRGALIPHLVLANPALGLNLGWGVPCEVEWLQWDMWHLLHLRGEQRQAPEILHQRFCRRDFAPEVLQKGFCTRGSAPEVLYKGFCSRGSVRGILPQRSFQGVPPGLRTGCRARVQMFL